MTRPPLANLFAVHDADSAMLDAIMLDLHRSGEFAEVWRPAPGWVAAAAPLPGGAADGEAVRQHQLAFAEGRDVLEHRSGNAPGELFREIAERADSRPTTLVSLPGDFGFIRFRPGGGATVVRSCGGLVPFYLWQSGPRWAIATRLGDLVRYLPDEPRLDPLVNAIWACSWPMFPEGRTFLAGVSILGRGWFARREGGRQMESGPYWNPRPKRVASLTPSLAREHAERLRTLLIEKLERDLDPEGGNLVCGSAVTLPDLWAQTPLRRLLIDVRTRSREPRDVARWAKHRLASFLGWPLLPFPKKLLERDPLERKPFDFFHPEVREAYRSWWDGRRREFRGDADPWRYLALESTALDGFVAMNWEACSALGIRRSLPFFNREVLELAFACHPTELYGPGPKKLLRSALRDDVPERNLQRPDKGAGGPQYQRVYRWRGPLPEGALPEELAGVVGAAWLSHPPQEVDYWPLRSLTRLLIFVACLRARRQERAGLPGQLQVVQ